MGKLQKQLRKKKNRERESVRKNFFFAEQLDYKRKFPLFVFKENTAPQSFVSLIKKSLSKFRLDDRRYFSQDEINTYKSAKAEGTKVIRDLMDKIDPITFSMFCNKIGELVFHFATSAKLQSWLPYNDVRILPMGRKIEVVFRSLCQKKTKGGTVYFSPLLPKITINGEEKIVGFTTHAIKQICERLAHNHTTYGGQGEVFAFIAECIHFEPQMLPSGQLAFTFYDYCSEGFWSGMYVKEILELEKMKPNLHYYYRIGYCPVVVEDGFAIAKTVLYPGYKDTPEHDVIFRSNLSRNEKFELSQKARQLSGTELFKSKDFSILKFFHDKGIHQVIVSKKRFYDSMIFHQPKVVRMPGSK
jgi:hypothetical protein